MQYAIGTQKAWPSVYLVSSSQLSSSHSRALQVRSASCECDEKEQLICLFNDEMESIRPGPNLFSLFAVTRDELAAVVTLETASSHEVD